MTIKNNSVFERVLSLSSLILREVIATLYRKKERFIVSAWFKTKMTGE